MSLSQPQPPGGGDNLVAHDTKSHRFCMRCNRTRPLVMFEPAEGTIPEIMCSDCHLKQSLLESSIRNGDSDCNSAPPADYWEHQVEEQVGYNIDNQNDEVHGDQVPPADYWEHQIDEQVEYNIDWMPLETLSSMDCLLTVTNGNLNWKSMPSAQNAENIGECGKETISIKLKVSEKTISPLMHKYLKLDFHLYEAGLLDTRVAEALIYFQDMETITASDLSLDERAKVLKQHNTEAVARQDLIKVSFATSQITFNMSTQQRLLVQGFDKAEERKGGNVRHGSRYADLSDLIDSLKSQNTKQTIQIDLLLAKPLLRGGEKWAEILNNVFEVAHSADQAEDQMAQWFPKSPESHNMPLGHVPRINDTLPQGLSEQDPLVRFHNTDQYLVTQIVGAANQAFAEEAAAHDLVSAEFAAKLIPLQSSNDNSQFIVVITPKGRDIYLPTLGESCHIKIPGIKPKNRTVPPDLDEITESIIHPVRAHADEMDASFVTSVREQLLKVMDLDKGADSCFTDLDIIDLRFRRDWDDGPEDHKARIYNFVETHAQLLLCETPENPATDEEVWFPATRMDSKIECVADDAQVYLASCPLEPKDDTGNVRMPVSVELPFVELEKSTRMDDYIKLVDEEQVDLKAIIRRDTSDKTIRAEVFAANALHNPASANTALIGDQSVEAFRYVQTFKRDEKIRSVNLLEKFPILLALSQSDGNQSALSECPEQIISQYLNLDTAKKSVISQLNNLPAGLAFIPGVAGSGKTELIKFIIAACIFGQGVAEPVPALYVAPNNQAVDDMANKFHEYFEKLGLEGAPTIMRLYGLDFEVKSVTRALAPGPCTSYQYFDEEKAQDEIKGMDTEAEKENSTDRAHQFLAVYQLERMGCDLNQQNKKSRSKRIRSTNVSADTAAMAYYQTHIEKYRDLQDILIISERDGSLSDDQLREVRILVKELFHDMLSDFKGIICTTSVVSANVTVRRFQAELVFTDEAARQSELGSLISVAHYQPHAWFFLGDTAQLKPYVGEDSKAADNPFIRQMSVSLLERAVLAGVELGWLDITHRLRGNLRTLPSKIHYGHRMQNTGLPGWNWPPSTIAFAAEMKKLLGPLANVSNPSRVVVQFPFARATLAGTSSKNITHVRWVLDQVKKMLQNPELTEINSKKMANVLILPLYKAQVDMYREKLHNERIQKRISDEHFRRIEVRTLDSAQGEERDVVIVDYVQTHKAGFCVDPNRNCLATTRAKQCEILIINTGMINSPRAENSKIGQILAEATELGIVLKVSSCSNCEDPSHKEDECDRKSESKLCNWCNENGHSYATCPKVQCRNCRKLGHVEPNCPTPKLCQQCGQEATAGHRKTCLGKRICSVCWECHTGDPCKVCAHCREKGHKAFECFMNPTSKKKPKNKPLKCNSCNELGHKAGDCPNKPPRTCHSCGSEDHVNRDCPTPRCKQCRELGHKRKDCPSLRCNHCGQLGHTQVTCQNRLVYCKKCKKSGHVAEDCQWEEGSSTRDARPDSAKLGRYKEMLRSRQTHAGHALGLLDILASNPRIKDSVEEEANDPEPPKNDDQDDQWPTESGGQSAGGVSNDTSGGVAW